MRIQRGIQNRKAELDFAKDRGVKNFHVWGRVQIIGDGETTLEVKFPVLYAEMPSFFDGWELAENQDLTAGALPTLQLGVARWVREEVVTGIHHYTGAILVCVTTNNPLYIWGHWHFVGTAFQNPVRDLDSPDPLSQT